MPFKFAWLVELLQELEGNRAKKAETHARRIDPDFLSVENWFKRHDHQIERQGSSGLAFLSSFLPERRPDRVYNIQDKRLSQIFGRALGLGSGRVKQLNAWAADGKADFPSCLENVMSQAEFDRPLPEHEVTLEEIDATLTQIAANSAYSSPELKMKANDEECHDLLQHILRRLHSCESKWFARMILKDYCPVVIPESLLIKRFHFLLPDVLDVQNSMAAAVTVLESPNIRGLPHNPPFEMLKALKTLLVKEMKPKLGVMIKRQPYHKARSIKHCCQMAGQRQISIERKYDGEYCQVHVDMRKGSDCITIFSKSGKDSTADRYRLQNALKDSLRLDKEGCRIKQKCIVEGELLIWNRTRKTIEPFYKIRRHVLHGGRPLGTAADSPAKLDEHLMIIFYDILLLDDKILMNEPLRVRRQHLKGIVQCFEGIADIAERRILNFRSQRAPEKLRQYFAHGITQRWEGFVLKGCDDPYISQAGQGKGIKLKKDYIAGLGDTADLCIVGGRHDPRVAEELDIGTVSWTHFYLGCLENKDEVVRFSTKPQFRVIDVLSHHNINKNDMRDLNSKGSFCQIPYAPVSPELDVRLGSKNMKAPTALFRFPIVVEIMGAGFEKPSDTRYWTLRFPRKLNNKSAVKIHGDRDIAETTSFAELQEMARQSLEAPDDAASQEDALWIQRLDQADPKNKYQVDNSQNTTPGKSPVSAQALSISPVVRRKKPPSPLIRVDTQELTTEELADRMSQSSLASTVTPSSLGSLIDQGRLPAPITPTKKPTSPVRKNTTHLPTTAMTTSPGSTVDHGRIPAPATPTSKRQSQDGKNTSSIATTVTMTPGSWQQISLKRKFPPMTSPTRSSPSSKRVRIPGEGVEHSQCVADTQFDPPPGSMENPIELDADDPSKLVPAQSSSSAEDSSVPLAEVVNVSPKHVRGRAKPRLRDYQQDDPRPELVQAMPQTPKVPNELHQDLCGSSQRASTTVFAMQALPLPTPPTSSTEQPESVLVNEAAIDKAPLLTPESSGIVADQNETTLLDDAAVYETQLEWNTMPDTDMPDVCEAGEHELPEASDTGKCNALQETSDQSQSQGARAIDETNSADRRDPSDVGNESAPDVESDLTSCLQPGSSEVYINLARTPVFVTPSLATSTTNDFGNFIPRLSNSNLVAVFSLQAFLDSITVTHEDGLFLALVPKDSPAAVASEMSALVSALESNPIIQHPVDIAFVTVEVLGFLEENVEYLEMEKMKEHFVGAVVTGITSGTHAVRTVWVLDELMV